MNDRTMRFNTRGLGYAAGVVTALIALALAIACMAIPPAAWASGESAHDADIDLTAVRLASDLTGLDEDVVMNASDGVSNSQINSSVKVREFSGETRYETAVSQAKAAYSKGSESAIIVGPDRGWIDALSASGLAASKGPILYSEKNKMNASSLEALKSLGVKSVIIVGGTAAVGTGVENDLKAAGIAVEKRLAGESYHQTQLAVFNYGLDNGYWSKDLIILATGSTFADALSVAPVAYAKKAPLFVTGPNNNLTVAQKTSWVIAAIEGFGKRVVVVGGSNAVSDASREYAHSMREIANGSGRAEWLYGATRYDTSAAIADWAVKNQGFTWDNAAFTTGQKPWDALAGAVNQGQSKSVMLLVDSTDAATIKKAGDNRKAIKNLRLFGGKAAIESHVRMTIADKIGFPVAALPNFKLYLDVGHGQNNRGNGVYDSGALGNGYQEHVVAKELAGKVAAILRGKGVDVFVNDDGGPYYLRHAEASILGCDEIISIHFNAAGGSGTLSLIHDSNASEYSKTLQDKIHPYLVKGMGNLHDYGKRPQQVAILSGLVPAVLLEICFIDNAHDMQTYQSRKDYLASQLATGIMS